MLLKPRVAGNAGCAVDGGGADVHGICVGVGGAVPERASPAGGSRRSAIVVHCIGGRRNGCGPLLRDGFTLPQSALGPEDGSGYGMASLGVTRWSPVPAKIALFRSLFRGRSEINPRRCRSAAGGIVRPRDPATGAGLRRRRARPERQRDVLLSPAGIASATCRTVSSQCHASHSLR